MNTKVKPKSNVVPLRAFDPVFFAKEDIKVGTILLHMGRLEENQRRYKVVQIHTFTKSDKENFRQESVDEVQKLSDVVYMTAVSGPPTFRRRATFGYLSYSAIWRIKS